MSFDEKDQHICKDCGTPYPEGDWRVLESYPCQFYHISCNPKAQDSMVSENEIAAFLLGAARDCAKVWEFEDAENKDDFNNNDVDATNEKEDNQEEGNQEEEDHEEGNQEEEDHEEGNQEEGNQEEGNQEEEDQEGEEDDAEEEDEVKDDDDAEEDLDDEDDKELCTCGGLRVGDCIQQPSSYCRIYTTIVIVFLLILMVGRSEYQTSDNYCIPPGL